ncbi:MAG: PQQ-binding-like beta-propeller repeat protein [Phycisphaerae bacterium]
MLIAWCGGPINAQPSNWPSFRGAQAAGGADGQSLPTQWNVDSGQNIAFKTAIPGLGHSSPVVWGSKLFVATAVSSQGDPYLKVGLYGASPDHPEDWSHEFRLYCLEAKTGDVIWHKTAYKGKPQVKRHVKATHANCTPATDGKYVVVSFGSEGLYCYDFEGELIWKKDLGYLDAGPYNAVDLQWGYASSPVIWRDRVIVQCDTRSQKFLAAYGLKTGKQLWRTQRNDVPTFSTPSVFEIGGQGQVVVNGYHHMGGYDAATGREIWRLDGGGDVPVPTPVHSEELIYLTNAHGGRSPIYAIRASAAGDITPAEGVESTEHIAWIRRAGCYMQTPLVYRGLIYACRDNGVLSCLDAATGKKQYRKRLTTSGQGFTASPVAADGKIYFPSEQGDIHVVKAGPEYELLAVNAMKEITMASPAIANGLLYIRGQHHLFGIGR